MSTRKAQQCTHTVKKSRYDSDAFETLWKVCMNRDSYRITLPCVDCNLPCHPSKQAVTIMGVAHALYIALMWIVAFISLVYIEFPIFSKFMKLLLCLILFWFVRIALKACLSSLLLKMRWEPAPEYFDGLTHEDTKRKWYNRAYNNSAIIILTILIAARFAM